MWLQTRASNEVFDTKFNAKNFESGKAVVGGVALIEPT